MHVVCRKCSHYFAVEISGRRRQVDCPQCGAFAGEPDHEGGLIVKLVCDRCGLGYAVDVLAERGALLCPGCAAAPKQRDGNLLGKLAEVWRLRRHAGPARRAREDDTGRVNLLEMEIDAELAARVPASVAVAYCCVPIRFENDILTVAIAEPVRDGVLDDLRDMLGCTVQGAASPRDAVLRAISRAYEPDAQDAQD